MKQFKDNSYGKEVILHIGQKVECTYYNEAIQWKETGIWNKDRTWWERFFDIKPVPFTPVKLGVIVGDAGIRPYYLAFGKDNGYQQYLYVQFREYNKSKAIPISCIKDAKESARITREWLMRDKHRLGEPGYGMESFMALSQMAANAENFTREPFSIK